MKFKKALLCSALTIFFLQSAHTLLILMMPYSLTMRMVLFMTPIPFQTTTP